MPEKDARVERGGNGPRCNFSQEQAKSERLSFVLTSQTFRKRSGAGMRQREGRAGK